MLIKFYNPEELHHLTYNTIVERSVQLLAQISNGTSLFQYTPTDIGDLLFCTSSNYAEQIDKKAEFRGRLVGFLTTLGICSAILFGSYFVTRNGYTLFGINIIFAVTALILASILITALKYLFNISSLFKGTDYFVGTKGFCVVNFRNSRSNYSVKTIFFKDASDLIFKRENISDVDGGYVHTSYTFALIESSGKSVLYSDTGYFDKSYATEKIIFLEEVLALWNKLKSQDLTKKYLSFNSFKVKNGAIATSETSFITIDEHKLVVNGTSYFYNDISRIGFQNDNLLIAIKGTKNILGNEKTIKVPSKNISNTDLFVQAIIKLIHEKDLQSF